VEKEDDLLGSTEFELLEEYQLLDDLVEMKKLHDILKLIGDGPHYQHDFANFFTPEEISALVEKLNKYLLKLKGDIKETLNDKNV